MGTVQKIEQEALAPAIITPADMIQQAIQQGSGIEVMERLLALQERHDAFQARKAYDSAISDLRANLPDIVKSQEGYGYKYEDLADIVRQVSPVMSERGLSFTWDTDTQNGEVIVTCILTHRDGHSNKTRLSARPDTTGSKNAIQAIGSAVTYLQRYTLKAALGIAASRDDDGAAAGQQDQAPKKQVAAQQKNGASKDASRDVYARLSKANRECADMDAFNRFWRARNVNEAFDSLPKDWRQELVNERSDKAAELEERAAMRDDDGFPFNDGVPADYVPPDFDHVPSQAAE